MTEQPLKVLIFGNSPTCLFLAWRLSLLNCYTIIVDSQSYDASGQSLYLQSSSDNKESSYSPDLYLDSINSYTSSGVADFIIVPDSSKSKQYITQAHSSSCCSIETIFLVDSTFAVGLEDQLKETLRGNPCFAVFCDIDFGVLKMGKKPILTYDNSGTGLIKIGRSIVTNEGATEKVDLKLKRLVQYLQDDDIVKSACFIPPDRTPSVGSYSWKRIIEMVIVEVVGIIYGSPNTEDLRISPVTLGIFRELVALARYTGSLEYPDPLDERKIKEKFKSMTAVYSRKGCSDSTIHSTTFNQLLQLAAIYKMKVPYLECAQSFYWRVEELKKEGAREVEKRERRRVEGRQYGGSVGQVSVGGGYGNGGYSLGPYSGYRANGSGTPGIWRPNFPATPLVTIHPRFHTDDNSSGSSIGGRSSTPSVQQVKNSLYRKSSASSFESYEEIAKGQRDLFEHANVKNLLEDTTSRYGEVDTIKRCGGSRGSEVRDSERGEVGRVELDRDEFDPEEDREEETVYYSDEEM